MKPLILLSKLGTIFAFATVTAHGAVIAADQFLTGSNPAAGEYNTTSTVIGQNPTELGFSAAWMTGSGSPDVVSSGLTFSNASGSVASSGGALRAETSGDRGGHLLSTALTSSTSGVFYVGFLLKLSSDTQSGYRAFEMHNGGMADTNRVFQLGQSLSDFGVSGIGLRINNNNALRLNLGAADTNTHFFVMKFNLSAVAGSDSVTVWRDPVDLGSEAASTVTGTLSGFDLNFDRVSLGAFISGGNILADEFRMATTWQEVSTVPEPSVALLSVLGILTFLRRRR